MSQGRPDRRRRKEPEHVEQRALFYWARLHEDRVPELRWLHAIPNGRGRTPAEAGKLKAEGVKPGVLDVALDVPRGVYRGLRIEMKAPGKLKDVSPEQLEWITFYNEQGFAVHVCDHWQLAWNALIGYVGRPDLRIDPELIAQTSGEVRRG